MRETIGDLATMTWLAACIGLVIGLLGLVAGEWGTGGVTVCMACGPVVVLLCAIARCVLWVLAQIIRCIEGD